MRILKVIHGYPMRYNAGSEVYSQTLCQALANRHDVHVFTRQEDAFAAPFAMRREVDPDDARVAVHLVNVANYKDRYRLDGVDERFSEVLAEVQPDVVHVGHLNHLSTALLERAARVGVPIVFTLHDYWLMCPRGQFMQMFPADPTDLWAACDGQDDRKCAERCYARYFSGAKDEEPHDIAMWTNWVSRRMAHVRKMTQLVDTFIAPARYLRNRFIEDFGLSASRIAYLDYGFDRSRFVGRARTADEPFTFGYIGTHIPAKGIHHLLQAFGRLDGAPHLRIWGRPRGQDTATLQRLASELPHGAGDRVEWRTEYRNADIVSDVFNHCDAIVVASVWAENSPLVIHEAQQARVPVIAANFGGMGEYVAHEVNGLNFEHRDPQSLAVQMQRLVDDPQLARRLGQRGYLFNASGDIPSTEEHVAEIEAIYEGAIRRRAQLAVPDAKGPWRITFDTNPDDCNLQCVMCEEHSPFSDRQAKRRARGQSPRRMDIALLRKVVSEAAPLGLREIIPSTMGEPLIYRHFDEILAVCREYGIKLNLTTNGTFPGRGARAWAEQIVPVTSDTKISWNGATKATQERIMVGGEWESMLANLRTFIEVRDAYAASSPDANRCRVTLQLTFLASNVHELADVVKLAATLGVDRVKGHHLWAHFDEVQGESMRRSPDAIEQWNGAVRAAQEVARTCRLPNGEQVLLDNIFELDPGAVDDLAPGGECPFLGREAWVSATGRFSPCCAPDEQRRTLGSFGNLRESSVHEIWTGDAYRVLRNTWHTRSLCRGCNMRRPEVL